MANSCPVCGGKMGLLNRERSADGLICASCMNFFYSKVGFQASKFSTKKLADFWAVQEKRRKQFKETDSLYDADALYVSVDDENGFFYFGRRSGDKGPRMIYAFDEVSGYESDSEDFTVTQTRGGIGRAVVGAAEDDGEDNNRPQTFVAEESAVVIAAVLPSQIASCKIVHNKTPFSFALCHPTAVCDGRSQTKAVFVKSAKLRSVSLRGMRYRGRVRFRTLASWFRSMPRSLARFCAIVLSCVSFLP